MWSLPNIRVGKLDRASGLPLKHLRSHLLGTILVYLLCLFLVVGRGTMDPSDTDEGAGLCFRKIS